ncbi:hypothetical protein AAE478_005784 [Parahypoxylon ruwenzoriense]
MDLASPTTSTSTNRGGRPKDWTEPRARRLVRLYIYTRLPFDLILKLLEDGVWKPGYVWSPLCCYDAANKVKNSLLGNDPRWIRPKDEEDEKRRIAALKKSRRGARLRAMTPTSHSARDHSNARRSIYRDDDSLTLVQSSQASFENIGISTSTQGGQGTISAMFDANNDLQSAPWIISGTNTTRQDTGLTNSTDTSMSSSFREKLSTVPRDQAKGAWRILKRYTLPKDGLSRGPSLSPMFSPESQFQYAYRGSHTLDGSTIIDTSPAGYAIPGDFLTADILTWSSYCEIGSSSHRAGTCWCRIVDQLKLVQNTWGSSHVHIPDSSYQSVDAFGNTAFHRLAATAGASVPFLETVSQALRDSHPQIHAKNTAGQTFLHVLHQSWFDNEPFLDRLLHILRDANFDILAMDVYGRSFFHILFKEKQRSARIPARLFDRNLLLRRDAFGVKPMDSRTVRHPISTMAQGIRRVGAMDAGGSELALTQLEVPSSSGEDSRIRSQVELLRIVVDAVKIDGVNSTNPNPRSEDSHGRNALHCLAEVELDADRVQNPMLDNQRQKKRKFKEEDEELKSDGSRHSQRLEFLEGILLAGVDTNHYDTQGQTPLMAFIKYRPEDSRSDKEDMEKAIKMIHDAGANLEERNREGETALHVAARSGKKVALKELLQLGANPFVRDAHGSSVLAVIDDLWENTEGDGVLTARLEACRGVFTSIVKDDAQEPTILQEWGLRPPVAG